MNRLVAFLFICDKYQKLLKRFSYLFVNNRSIGL